MKIGEIRERTDEELVVLADQLQDDHFRLRVKKATNQLENTGLLRINRRELAQVRTVQRARVLKLEQTLRATSLGGEEQE